MFACSQIAEIVLHGWITPYEPKDCGPPQVTVYMTLKLLYGNRMFCGNIGEARRRLHYNLAVFSLVRSIFTFMKKTPKVVRVPRSQFAKDLRYTRPPTLYSSHGHLLLTKFFFFSSS
jgi:hypothetical protein